MLQLGRSSAAEVTCSDTERSAPPPPSAPAACAGRWTAPLHEEGRDGLNPAARAATNRARSRYKESYKQAQSATARGARPAGALSRGRSSPEALSWGRSPASRAGHTKDVRALVPSATRTSLARHARLHCGVAATSTALTTDYGLPVIGPCNYRPVITAVITCNYSLGFSVTCNLEIEPRSPVRTSL